MCNRFGCSRIDQLMLTAFSVQNYRSFAEPTRVELRPLTLLFGHNNAGKSALVRALPLLADSMRADATSPVDLDSPAVREAIFGELLSKHTDSSTLTFELEFEGGLKAAYDVTRPTGSLSQSITSIRISHPEAGRMTLESLSGAGARYRLLREGSVTGAIVEDPFSGLAPTVLQVGHWPDGEGALREAYHRIIDDLRVASYALNRETLWLGSLRRYPDRFVRVRDGGARKRIAHDGHGVAQLLAIDELTGKRLTAEVSAWYEDEKTFARRLGVVQSPDDQFSVTLEPVGALGLRVNMADTGEGMAQVLPVLVAGVLAKQGGRGAPRLLALEQPELHLHPAVHAPLARWFCDMAATDAPPHTLIETHSENFLLGVQLQIVKGELPPDRVLVYWVQQLPDGRSKVTRVTFDDQGRPHGGWPPGVFSMDLELMREIIDRRRRRDSAS